MAQTIPSFSSSKTISGQSLTEFRNYVSQAKKLGLVPASTDARTARPYFIRGGKTLAETINKNKSKLKPFNPSVKKAKSKLLSPDKPISIRDLPIKGKSLATALKEMERDPSKFDALKRSNERWGFQVGKEQYGSIQIFGDIDLMVDYLRHYDGNAERASNSVFHKRSKSDRLFQSFKLVRWTGTNNEWKKFREKRVHKARHQVRRKRK